MKRISLILISVLSLSFLFGQKGTDKPNPMRGVKTLTRSIYVYEEKFGEFIEVLKEKTIHKYDSKGNEVEISNYDSDGNLTNSDDGVSRTIYKYDSNGNMVEESYYDSDGNLTHNFFESSKISYKYDSNGNMVEYSLYDSDGSLNEKHISKYDSNGNMVEESGYDSDGSLNEKHIPKYDSNGNMVETSVYDSDGSLDIKTNYKYDSEGNQIEYLFEIFSEYISGMNEKTVTKYNRKNLPVEQMSYKQELKFGELQEKPNRKTIYEYEEY